MSRRIVVPLLAITVVGITACGATDSSPSAETGSLTELTVPSDSDIRVQTAVDLSSDFAGRLEPLDAKAQAPMSVTEALDLMRTDPVAARFFDEPDSKLEIRLGVFVAEDLGDEESKLAANARGIYERFVAYVISGGSDVCLPSGTPNLEVGSPSASIPCSAVVVVDAEHRTVPFIVETG